MVESTDSLRLKYSRENIKNADTKIAREVKKGNLIKLKNGLYETDPKTNGMYLGCVLYGPSYISFDYALAHYGLIPERVVKYTLATYNKKKKKEYKNQFGIYIFQDVPKECYSVGIDLVIEGNYSYQIASPEKALCDKLYTLPPIKNLSDMEIMLFDDLRIDEDEFLNLNYDLICDIEKYYHSTNVTLLKKYFKRRMNG